MASRSRLGSLSSLSILLRDPSQLGSSAVKKAIVEQQEPWIPSSPGPSAVEGHGQYIPSNTEDCKGTSNDEVSSAEDRRRSASKGRTGAVSYSKERPAPEEQEPHLSVVTKPMCQ
ncbi:hypothetical protein FZEAL_10903 [Fusarium zealandicum]|uniref:Uncharacterized protein n=1 Tax=Fusarium zealandicum TaxID=1053134 RepID=A0A8H4X6Q1_9HYPO|nr:hypothetical protein FZEAL_10903 [Fusarium zealandicum]